MASGISFSGLSSGMDTAGIINTLLKVDQVRIDALQFNRSSIDRQVSAVGTLKSKLSTLQTKLEAFRFQSQVLLRSATTDTPSGQAPSVTATADSTAAVGSFKVTVDWLATATNRHGLTGVGNEAIDLTSSLSTAGLALTPTAGRFTINGVSIDASAATTVQGFVDAINNQQSGVIAEAVDAGGNPSATPVRIQLRNADGSNTAILAGSAGDTSNFLTAAKLSTAVQVGDRLESTATLGRLRLATALQNSRLATPLSQPTGTFTINGVSFSYDEASDTLASKLAEISNSSANVSATYDAVSNRITLTAKGTGAQSIALSDTTGNFLQALGVTDASGATETLGQNAQYRIDTVAGGAPQASTSNTVSGVVPGVTLNLQQATATPVTVTVSQDLTNPLAAMKEIVTAYNDVLDYVRSSTRPDANGKPGLLQGSSGVRMLGDTLRSMAFTSVAGLAGPYSTLNSIGISTGVVGSAVGTTNNLQFDEAKFQQAMQSNPQGVYELLNNATAGSQGVFAKVRSYVNSATLPNGLISSITDGASARKSAINSRIEYAQKSLETKRARLEAQFSRMESALATLQAQGQRLQSQLSKLG